jgi:hypothetical protein
MIIRKRGSGECAGVAGIPMCIEYSFRFFLHESDGPSKRTRWCRAHRVRPEDERHGVVDTIAIGGHDCILPVTDQKTCCRPGRR